MVLQVDVIEGESKSLQCLFPNIRLQLTLPNSDAVPTHLCQFLLLFLVPFLVPLNLLLPKVGIRLWHPEVLASIVSMPKASVDKHARAVLAQYNIRMARQARIVQPVSEALSPQIFAHKNLRLRVLGMNSSHILVALLWCESVHNAKVQMFLQTHAWKTNFQGLEARAIAVYEKAIPKSPIGKAMHYLLVHKAGIKVYAGWQIPH